MTIDGLLRRLRAECNRAGSQNAFARKHKISVPYLSDVLNRRRDPGPAILVALGLKKNPATYSKLRSPVG